MAFYIISTAAFLAAVTYIGIKFGPKITQLDKNPEECENGSIHSVGKA